MGLWQFGYGYGQFRLFYRTDLFLTSTFQTASEQHIGTIDTGIQYPNRTSVVNSNW